MVTVSCRITVTCTCHLAWSGYGKIAYWSSHSVFVRSADISLSFIIV